VAPIAEIEEPEWQRMLAVNITGVYLSTPIGRIAAPDGWRGGRRTAQTRQQTR